jgi:hypothetical protein
VCQFKVLYLISETEQIINIVISVCKAGLFVLVDVKRFAAAIFQTYFLVLKVDGDDGFRILFDGIEDLLQERVRNLNREERIIQCVILEDVREKAGDHNT